MDEPFSVWSPVQFSLEYSQTITQRVLSATNFNGNFPAIFHTWKGGVSGSSDEEMEIAIANFKYQLAKWNDGVLPKRKEPLNRITWGNLIWMKSKLLTILWETK